MQEKTIKYLSSIHSPDDVKKIPENEIDALSSEIREELVRIVKSPEGTISLDLTGKKNGRGAYICKKEECLEAAFKKKQLDYAFKEKVEASCYEKIREEFIKNVK